MLSGSQLDLTLCAMGSGDLMVGTPTGLPMFKWATIPGSTEELCIRALCCTHWG